MATGSPQVWLIRAGRKSEAENLFLEWRTLVLGPPEVCDIGELDNRESFKDRFRTAFPDATPTGIGGGAGQLFRSVHEAKTRDVVVYTAKDGRVHIGVIQGKYQYNPESDESFPHLSKVRWLWISQRTEMSEDFLWEARAFKSFYQISKCEDEVLSLLSAKQSQGSGKNR